MRNAAAENDKKTRDGPRYLRRLVQRLRVRRIRREKAGRFLARWDGACNRLWLELQTRPRTKETFAWFERNHNRLMRVVENETKRIDLRRFLR